MFKNALRKQLDLLEERAIAQGATILKLNQELEQANDEIGRLKACIEKLSMTYNPNFTMQDIINGGRFVNSGLEKRLLLRFENLYSLVDKNFKPVERLHGQNDKTRFLDLEKVYNYMVKEEYQMIKSRSVDELKNEVN